MISWQPHVQSLIEPRFHNNFMRISIEFKRNYVTHPLILSLKREGELSRVVIPLYFQEKGTRGELENM